MSEIALVYGLGASGVAVARHLRDRGARVVAADDAGIDRESVRTRAAEAGVDVVIAPDENTLRGLMGTVDVVVPGPGVPETHAVFALAAELGKPVRGDLELAGRWTRKPIVAVTGTNGKTTVTELIASMLVASGVNALACGNIGLPLGDAVRRPVDVFVAEVSSFQLHSTDSFRPAVAVWLNLADDHLDWHADLRSYAAAKARIWEHQVAGDVAVVNADDPVVMAWAEHAPSRLVTFGSAADYFLDASTDELRGPNGTVVSVGELGRALPHDIANGLAAAAAADAAGASPAGVAEALRVYRPGAHRLELVGERGGVRWYDDSKATNPHATLAAVAGSESVVLLAGGRNKGLDLSPLAATSPPVRAVVGFGEAGSEVVALFDGRIPTARVETMAEAVDAAGRLAQPGDAVLLSPACASFDQYRSYAERGDDFARLVQSLLEES